MKQSKHIGGRLPRAMKADDAIIKQAVYIAIEKAERFKTSLTVKHNGKIEQIRPAILKRRLSQNV